MASHRLFGQQYTSQEPAGSSSWRRTLPLEPANLGHHLALLAVEHSDTFTPTTLVDLNHLLYTTLRHAAPSAFPLSSSLPYQGGDEWTTFKLSDHQSIARRRDFKGKGKERAANEVGQPTNEEREREKMGCRPDRCERAFERGDLIYRIKDVTSTDSLALLCQPCFLRSPYTEAKSLQLKIATGTGDFCSCGDTKIWGSQAGGVVPGCGYHEPVASGSGNGSDDERLDVDVELLDADGEHEERQLRTLLGELLDYILVTLASTPVEPSLPTASSRIAYLPRIPLSDLHPTEVASRAHQTAQFIGTPLDPVPVYPDLYAVVLWNDEKHTREDVAVQLGDAVGWPESRGFACAESVHREGRETIMVSHDINALLHAAHTLSQIDLGVTMRPAKDNFHERVSSYIVSFLLDLAACEGDRWRRVLWRELSAVAKPLASSASENFTAVASRSATRFEKLLLDHTKWWKRPRAEWGQLMGRLGISSNEVRLEMAESLSKLFPALINSFLFTDRESDTSTLALTSKLFPIPSIAAHIVCTRSHLSTYLLVLRSFYTNQYTHKRILLPPSAHILRVEPDSEAFKMKKASPLFSHLKELLAAPGVQQWIAHTPRMIEEVLRLLAIFTEMNPTKRAAENHVEYESEAWIKAFQVSGDLGRVARLWSLSYNRGTRKDLWFTIASISREIYRMATLAAPGLDASKFHAPAWHTVAFGRGRWRVLALDVQAAFMSFHHPIHWLLAGCLKLVTMMDGMRAQELREVMGAMLDGAAALEDEERIRQTNDMVLVLMDVPLKVAVYVAQLRNGLWVRNGQSMRQQHHHYREHTALGIREVAWDNDVFLLQVALCTLDPDTVLATFLDRFALLDWFSGNMDHPVYTHPAAGMAEEFLLLLITCLTEPANLCAWSEKRFVRREIVHALVLGATTYSDLIKKLPERVNESVHLATTLEQVATFRRPETNNDLGMYELRSECFAEVDALFHHYSRNQKQEVEDLLERRWRKAHGAKKEYLHVPKPMEVPPGPYAGLPLVYRSELIPHIVHSTLWNLVPLHRLANKEGSTDGKTRESQESVLELALHLAMLCLQQEPETFARVAGHEAFVPDWTLVRLLCSIEDEELFRTIKPRVAWCLDACRVFCETEVVRWRVVPPPVPAKTESAGAARKSKAASRQAAIMSRFTKDQQAFLEAHGDEDDEDDDMDLGRAEADIVYGACMVCQEECTSSLACGCLAMIQPSKLIRRAPAGQLFSVDEALLLPDSLDQTIELASVDAPSSPASYPRNSFRFGLHTSTCGHLMHLACFEGYTKTTENRHHAQAARNHPENVARKEFNCPLCKSLGNVLLPMQNPYDRPTKPVKSDELPLRDWLRFINLEALRDVPDTSLMFTHRTETGELPPLYADAAQTVNFPEQEQTPLFESTKKMLGELYAVVRPISQQSVHLRPKSLPETVVQDRPAQGIYLPDELVAYTLAGLEVTQRGQASPGTSVADSLNGSTSQLLKCLLGSLRHATAFNLGGAQGLTSARYGLFARLLPDWYRDHKTSSALLLRDPLGILVEGAAIAYEYLQPILILTFYAELCRAVLGLLHLVRSFPGRPAAWLKTQEVDAAEARAVFGDVKLLVGGMCAHSRILQFEFAEYLLCLPDDVLARLLYAFTLPFLRRAALLHRVVKLNSTPSSSLLHLGASAVAGDDGIDAKDGTQGEYRRLLAQLHIPSPAGTLSPPAGKEVEPFASAISDTVSSYLKQFSATYGPRSPSSLIELEYPSIYQLARLPSSLEGVFATYGRRECASCRTIPSAMAVCLFCGEGVCVGVSCCREDVWGGAEGLGECNLHMRRCNAPIGIFLDLRKWQVLWLWAGTGSWGSNFYLDTHGELDQSMKRGFRQFLHPPRLDDIRKTWLTHSVPSFVARKMEALLDGGGWMSF